MAVLVEGISVIIKKEAIIARYPGGWDELKDNPPNKTLCADNELVRIGFMTPDDAHAYVESLAQYGILHREDGKAVDIVVADQKRGFTSQCDWAEFGNIDWHNDPNMMVSVCRRIPSKCNQLLTPDGWQYDNSLSANFKHIETRWVSEFMDFLRHENGIDVYRDLETGKEVYVGRTNA